MSLIAGCNPLNRVMALDPSTTNIGVAIFVDDELNDWCCIRPDKKATNNDMKALSIIFRVARIIRLFNINLIVTESPIGKPRDFNAIRGCYLSKGWMQGIAGALNIEYQTVDQFQVKEAITGRKTGVSKEMMIEEVGKLYPSLQYPMRAGKIVKGKAEHIADAIGAYVAYQRTKHFRESNLIDELV